MRFRLLFYFSLKKTLELYQEQWPDLFFESKLCGKRYQQMALGGNNLIDNYIDKAALKRIFIFSQPFKPSNTCTDYVIN